MHYGQQRVNRAAIRFQCAEVKTTSVLPRVHIHTQFSVLEVTQASNNFLLQVMFQQIVFLLQFSQDFSSFDRVAKISTDSTSHPGIIAMSQVSGREPETSSARQGGDVCRANSQKSICQSSTAVRNVRAVGRPATLSTAALNIGYKTWQFVLNTLPQSLWYGGRLGSHLLLSMLPKQIVTCFIPCLHLSIFTLLNRECWVKPWVSPQRPWIRLRLRARVQTCCFNKHLLSHQPHLSLKVSYSTNKDFTFCS